MSLLDLSRGWLLALTLGGAALILIYLGFVLWRSRTRVAAVEEPAGDAPGEPGGGAAPDRAGSGPGEDAETLAPALQRSFRDGVRRMLGALSGARSTYRVPWFLLAGAAGSRPRRLLAGTGLHLPFGEPAEAPGCTWWLLEHGVVIDLDGDLMLRADGASADERGRRALLRLLEKHRPERPIDGMVLTVSSTELEAAQRGGEAGLADLERRATALFGALRQVQHRLGLRFPIYVLITGCEAIRGFDAFARAIPERLHGSMLGWSSPFSVDTAYRDGWMDEAVAALSARLDRIQLEILAEQPRGVDLDEVYLFPGTLLSLTRPLRAWLDALFKPSAYHESMLLRGLYLCGRADAAGGDGTRGRRGLFLRDLIEAKVFAEAGLAAPTAATLVARNRTVRLAVAGLTVAALVLGLGTWRAARRLDDSRRTLARFVDKTAVHLADVGDRRRKGSELGAALLRDSAEHVLSGLARIDPERFGSVFIPSSWFSPFNDQLKRAMVTAYGDLVLEAIHGELSGRAAALSSPEWPRQARLAAALERGGGAGVDGVARPIAEMPSFQRLQAYVGELNRLDEQARSYNGLRDSADLSAFSGLVEYSFGIPLPENFVSTAGPFSRALHRADHPAFDLAPARPGAADNARLLARDLYRRLFREGELVRFLTTLEADLDRLTVAAPESNESFDDAILRLIGIEDALSGRGLEWAFRDRFALGPAYDRVLVDVERSRFLGPEVRSEIQAEGEEAWSDFRASLLGYRSRLTEGGFLAVEDGGARMELAPETVALKTALETFHDQPFLVLPPEPLPFRADLPAGERLLWDRDLLAQAADLSDEYRRFRANSGAFDYFPGELRPSLERIARHRLGVRMSDLVARAQSYEPVSEAASPLLREPALRAEIAAYEAAAKPLRQLVEQFRLLRLDAEAEELAALGAEQGVRLLAGVDELLEAERLYQPSGGDFSSWRGTGPVSAAAFDARDPEELAVRLAIQRRRLQQLGDDYARPLVTWLTAVAAGRRLPDDRGLLFQWESILDGLHDYRTQKPGNPLAALERYIVEELPAVELDGCWAGAGAAAPASAGDWFVARRDRLRRQLVERCGVLAGERAEAGYRELSALFNQRLAGRYPFADSNPDAFAAEAAPEDLRSFFALFDRHAPLLRALPADAPGLGAARGPALEFVARMGAVRELFAGFLDAEEPEPAPSFDLEAEFRVHQAAETGGHRIVDWGLTVGEREISFRDAERTARWTVGRPLRLTLRWAGGSPTVPAARAGDPRPALRVAERSAVYEHRNLWSLLALLETHRAPARDLDGAAEPPHVLALVVDTRAAESGTLDPTPTRVFVRLTVKAPGSTRPLELPRFPHRAPRLDPPRDRS